MSSGWKYYASRLLTGLFVLFIVILILTSLFTYYSYERRMVDVRWEVSEEIKDNSTIHNMTYQERLEWKENRTEVWRERFGVKKSYWEKTMDKTFRVFTGDLGKSRTMQTVERPPRQDVMDIILEVFPRTVLLYASSAAIYLSLGLVWGLHSAQKDKKSSKVLSILSMIGSSIPMWWLGMLFLLVFSFRFDLFPSSAFPFGQGTGVDYYISIIHDMTLPVATIVLTMFGARAYTTRNLISSILEEDYIMASRARGTPEKNVIYGHALKTASPTLVSNSMRAFLLAMPALIITEVVFGWPGIGFLYYRAAVTYIDIPVILGLTFFNTILYISIWLIADLVTGFLDPRVKFGENNSR